MNILVLLSFLLVSISVGTSLAFASSSEDDEPQDEENSQSSQDTQQSQVTWRTFNHRDNLATVQYPSTWTPSGIAESMISGPIDILFTSPGSDQDSGAEIEFIQFESKSPFNTPRESLESEIAGVQSSPANTNFEIERPIECSKYTLNGLPACSVIYEVNAEGIPIALMQVDALANDGTEYEVYYRSDFESFERFLPIVESMVNSFKTTGSSSASDFSLSEGSNATNQQDTNLSSDDDFSLS